MKKGTKVGLVFLTVLFLIVVGILIAETTATTSGSSENSSLTIWDGSDSDVKYTYCGAYCTEKSKPSSAFWDIRFYANYTNSSSSVINASNGNGNCSIRFNETGTWTGWSGMSYNGTSFLWEYNRSFNYKGTLNFSTNCTSSYGDITILDGIIITNTEPHIPKSAQGYIDFNGDYIKDTLRCTEDTLCYYNFSSNVSEDDLNDVLTFGYNSTTNTTLTNFTMNSATGMLEINITRNEETGIKKIELTVHDTESVTKSGVLEVNITGVNDAPVFVNLEDKAFNMSELFEYIINITDEENNFPFVLNISFISCSVAQWSTRNCSESSGRELFNSSQYSFNSTSGILNISFAPQKNDVGSYVINLSVTDNSSQGNKTASRIVNFTVLNINSIPYFTYVCNNERNATENYEFTCQINATDIDETNNLTFASNYSWFKFNNSASSIAISVNISTGYNASAIVNFTPTDINVGNWSVNITLTDTGAPVKSNSSVFWFFINNTEDSVSLSPINNLTIYGNTNMYVNATDDDLLVPDKNVKNENLTFFSNASWVSVSTFTISGNITTARIEIDYNTIFNSSGDGNYSVKINVTDTAGNYAERNFTIKILGNNAAVWNTSMGSIFVIYENNLTYINFSQNVSDSDGDVINFSFTSDSSFPSFNINSTTGIVNFTPVDADVGYHNITLNASDGKSNSLKSFNFTVYNVNDAPFIETPLTVTNASIDASSNINSTEDNYTIITLWIQDNDFKIPSAQKSFYNESLSVNLNISGVNTSLFNLVVDSSFPTPGNNRSRYTAIFTPRKSDIGVYNITINITDRSNVSVVLQFNLTVFSINHAPVLMSLTNQTSSINRSFYYRINATDIEDGSSFGNTNFTFRYAMLSGLDIFTSAFNSTNGVFNITFNSNQGGRYHLNITVNDSLGSENSKNFWVYVYDYPNITFPLPNYEFNLVENTTSNLTFKANHSVNDNLTFQIYIQNFSGSNILRYNMSYYGNATNLTWQFTPNLTDETYGVKNLTLIVIPAYSDLNTSYTWNITINHTNAPVIFLGHIGDAQSDYNHNIEINLRNYFSDIDYADVHYNQTINFTITSNSTPSYIIPYSSISNWVLTLSSLIAVAEIMTINATDFNSTNSSLTSMISNSFEIRFTTPSTTTTQVSGGGGGGTRLTLLKIILPEPVSAYKKDKIIIPITLSNEGIADLYDIYLTGLIAKNMTIRKDVNLSFDKSYFSSIPTGEKKNTNLTIDIDTEEVGLYEITINASVGSPKYMDWGKLYLTVKEANKSEILEIIIFTEEFIAKNPECIEIKEIIKEARKYYENGNYTETLEKTREAIDACRASIAQPALPTLKLDFRNELYKYLSLSAFGAFAIGILYYVYKKIKFRRGKL